MKELRIKIIQQLWSVKKLAGGWLEINGWLIAVQRRYQVGNSCLVQVQVEFTRDYKSYNNNIYIYIYINPFTFSFYHFYFSTQI